MLEIVHDSNRNVLPYGHDKCRDSVYTWCQRILERDKSIQLKESKWKYNDNDIQDTALLFDAVMCQLWYAKRCMRDGDHLSPKSAYIKYKDAATSYAYVLDTLLPRWTFKHPVHAQHGLTSRLTCALSYLKARERMLRAMMESCPTSDTDTLSGLCGTRAALALLCSRFNVPDVDYSGKDAYALSAHALFYKGAAEKSRNAMGAAASYFMHAKDRYDRCSMLDAQHAQREALACSASCCESVTVDASPLFRLPLPPL